MFVNVLFHVCISTDLHHSCAFDQVGWVMGRLVTHILEGPFSAVPASAFAIQAVTIFQNFLRFTVTHWAKEESEHFSSPEKRQFGGESPFGQGALENLKVSVESGCNVALRV